MDTINSADQTFAFEESPIDEGQALAWAVEQAAAYRPEPFAADNTVQVLRLFAFNSARDFHHGVVASVHYGATIVGACSSQRDSPHPMAQGTLSDTAVVEVLVGSEIHLQALMNDYRTRPAWTPNHTLRHDVTTHTH